MNYQKELHKNTLFRLTNVDATDVVSFDCGSYLSMFVNTPQEEAASIIPDREEASGLTHAYKEGSKWKFIPESEYEQRQGELPNISFAIRQPFSDFTSKATYLPDLNEVYEKIVILEEEAKKD